MADQTLERPIYLDHNASTPVTAAVRAAMAPYLDEEFGNPSSQHAYGRRARAAVDAARERVAAAIGARTDEIVFTSGGTEASNLALLGVAATPERARHLVTSTIEHPATAAPSSWLESEGWRVSRVGTDDAGVVRVDEVAAALDAGAGLVTLIHAHNETGVVQPIARVATLTRARGAVLHTDAAQSLGKIPVRVDELGVDLLTIAGHKLGAPKGVGALYVRTGQALVPVLRGASHERGLRPGTENVASLVGLGVACEEAMRDLAEAGARLRALRERLWLGLEIAVPGMARHGEPDGVLPNTLSVRFPGARGADILALAPEVAASTGSACHDGHDVAPGAIVAMGIAPAAALGTVRLTLGRLTTEREIDVAARLLARAWADRGRAARAPEPR